MLSLGSRSLAYLVLSATSAQLAFADIDTSSCNCYKTNTSDRSVTSSFNHYSFTDFRSLGSNVESPANVSNSQNKGHEKVTNAYFTSNLFASQWAIQNWTQSRSEIDSSVSTVNTTNSAQNVYIGKDQSSGATYLTLRTTRLPSFQSISELDSTTSLQYASLRVRARISGAPGAVAGIFFYEDDDNESDIEILTRDPTSSWRATNNPDVDAAGNSIPGASTVDDLPARGSAGKNSTWAEWNDYRLDWHAPRCSWFVNGHVVDVKSYGVPKGPANAVLNLWGNGGFWSGNMSVGKGATMEVQWIELVYNGTGDGGKSGCGRRGAKVCMVDNEKTVGKPVPTSSAARKGIPSGYGSWASAMGAGAAAFAALGL